MSDHYTPEELDRLMAALYPTPVEKILEAISSATGDLEISLQRRRVRKTPWPVWLGAIVGNWNDRHSHHDSRSDASLRWRVVDKLAHELYTWDAGDEG